MLKLITEPARRGVGYYRTLRNEYRAAKHFTLDEDLNVDDIWSARVQPMRAKTIGYDGKESSCNPNPLKRFLYSQVGKNWDETFSQISSINNKLSRHYDIKKMVGWFVETNTFIEDDEIYYSCRYHGARSLSDAYDQLYVHPVTHVLCISSGESYKSRNKQKAENKKIELNKVRRIVNREIQFHKVDGNWYRVKVRPIDFSVEKISVDVLGSISDINYFRFSIYDIARSAINKYGFEAIAVEKRAASNKEIRNFKLN
jgi:hypothetical protein